MALVITPDAHTDDKVLNSTDDTLHRSKDNILRRNKAYNSYIRRNTLHRNMDIHSKHVYRLDDKPDERADGRVHNSTVHNFG